MAKVKFSITAAAYGGDNFHPDAFRNSIGKSVPLTIGNNPLSMTTILDANVAPDGRSATLTVEVPDETMPPDTDLAASLGFSL
jgi:hypothetical protein